MTPPTLPLLELLQLILLASATATAAAATAAAAAATAASSLLTACPTSGSVNITVPSYAWPGYSLLRCNSGCRLSSEFQAYKRVRDRVMSNGDVRPTRGLTKFFYAVPEDAFELANNGRLIRLADRPMVSGLNLPGLHPVECRDSRGSSKFLLNIRVAGGSAWRRRVNRYQLDAGTSVALVVEVADLLAYGNSLAWRSRSLRLLSGLSRTITGKLVDNGARLVIRCRTSRANRLVENFALVSGNDWTVLRVTVGQFNEPNSWPQWRPQLLVGFGCLATVCALGFLALIVLIAYRCVQRPRSTSYKQMNESEPEPHAV